jgi:hypothetical protein
VVVVGVGGVGGVDVVDVVAAAANVVIGHVDIHIKFDRTAVIPVVLKDFV